MVAVEGTVLQAWRGVRVVVLPWSRHGPRSRVVPMPFEGLVEGEVQRKYGELAAQ